MFKGSIVALVTPFTKKGGVDEERLRFLVNWHIENKTDSILVCGTTGESATLTHDEHKRVVTVAIEEAGNRIPIIAGAGSNATHESLDLGMYASKVKAAALLVITPYYNRPTQEGLYLHFKKISKGVRMPVIIYNVPSRTGVNILPETVARIYKSCPNVIGIKEASASLDQITRIMTLVDGKFVLLSGSDEVTLPILSLGARGVVSVVANIAPVMTHNLVDSYLKGDIDKSKKIQFHLYGLIKALFIETNPIPVKTALGLMGMIEPNLRLPLCAMNKVNFIKLQSTLKKYKLI
ncbi:MAG: 4-hydroxy-tetrahydrodipicolinate synthase [Candidatus Omnitrophota bacterium]